MGSRQPVQIVEIDVDFCSLTYGTAPCTAALDVTGKRKCFNTFATCQDRAKFARVPLTLRFATPTSRLPKGSTIFPVVTSVSTRPNSVNIAGVDKERGPLGRRATVKVEMMDFPYHDRLVDKYAAERVTGAAQTNEGGYDPATRSTFFAKLRARWPFHEGRALRVVDGYLSGNSVVGARTRHYVITGFDGPDSDGRVTWEAKDVLALAENDKAQAPAPSSGRLAAGISDSAGSLTLSPTGIGSSYPASGLAAIGSEIVSFTRSGDVMTIGRGAAGTVASSHSAADTVQLALHFSDVRVDNAIAALIGYAGIPSAFIPAAEWEAEITRWAPAMRLNGIVPAPTGVAELIGEIMILGFSLWWDEVEQKLRLKANRPPDTDVVRGLSDRSDIAAVEAEDRPADRLTQVLFYSVQIDPTKSATDPSNYRRLMVTVDAEAEGANEFGDVRTRKIFSRWLGTGMDGEVAGISVRLLNRFRTAPRLLRLTLDAKDRDIALADVAVVESRVVTDETGAPVSSLWEVVEREETESGHALEVQLQSYLFQGRYGFITENARPIYDESTDAERSYGAYLVDEDTLLFPDGSGPYQII